MHENPLTQDEKHQFAAIAHRCAELHLRWYEQDQPSPRPILFDYWRPVCTSGGKVLDAALVVWRQLEIGITWQSAEVDLKVDLPDGSKISVTDEEGPWNAVARQALEKIEELALELEQRLPHAPAQTEKVSAQDTRLMLAKRLMRKALEN